MSLSWDLKFDEKLKLQELAWGKRKAEHAARISLKEQEDAQQKRDEEEAKEIQKLEEDKIHRGYDVLVPRADTSEKKIEVPFMTQVLALEFVILFLVNNKHALLCKTTEEFAKLFDPFFTRYVDSYGNFKHQLIGATLTKKGLKSWCQNYYATRPHPQRRRNRYEEACWRFLSYVNITNCLRAISKGKSGFYSWVTVSDNGSLRWHLTLDELESYKMPNFVYHGYHKDQAERARRIELAKREKRECNDDDDDDGWSI